MRISVTPLLLATLATIAFLASSSATFAEEALRWKFEQGEKLDYSMVQAMKMKAEGGPLGQMETDMRQEMNMTWDVQEVHDSGEAVIRQSFDRIQMKMNTPAGGFEYDSQSDEAPTGMAAMIAPMYKVLTEHDFIITMTDRGEVKDVQIPEEVLNALKANPGAAAIGEMATSDGFKKMISQGMMSLPENPPKEGEEWMTTVEMNNPMVGKQTINTTYRFEGLKEVDGETVAVIRPRLKMEFGAPAQAQVQMKISEQSSDGEVLFNVAEGRLQSSSIKQNLTLDITAGGQSMKQNIDQTVDVKVSRAAESSSEAKSTDNE